MNFIQIVPSQVFKPLIEATPTPPPHSTSTASTAATAPTEPIAPTGQTAATAPTEPIAPTGPTEPIAPCRGILNESNNCYAVSFDVCFDVKSQLLFLGKITAKTN